MPKQIRHPTKSDKVPLASRKGTEAGTGKHANSGYPVLSVTIGIPSACVPVGLACCLLAGCMQWRNTVGQFTHCIPVATRGNRLPLSINLLVKGRELEALGYHQEALGELKGKHEAGRTCFDRFITPSPNSKASKVFQTRKLPYRSASNMFGSLGSPREQECLTKMPMNRPLPEHPNSQSTSLVPLVPPIFSLFFSKTDRHFPRVLGGFLERRIPGMGKLPLDSNTFASLGLHSKMEALHRASGDRSREPREPRAQA